MTCPRCEIGTITNIQFKSGQKARVCDACEAVWLEGEQVSFNSSHTLTSSELQGNEYTIETTEEKDQEHRPVEYSKYK